MPPDCKLVAQNLIGDSYTKGDVVSMPNHYRAESLRAGSWLNKREPGDVLLGRHTPGSESSRHFT